MLCTCFFEHPYCTDSDILFLFLLTNVLIVSRFGKKPLLNALNVNVNVNVMHLHRIIYHSGYGLFGLSGNQNHPETRTTKH